MKKITLLVFLTFSAFGYSQNIEQKLKADIVKIETGKFTIDDYTLVTTKGKNIQIKVHAEASNNGFISRDNFIYFTSSIIDEIVSQFTAADENAKTEDLEEITGKADIIVNCFMSKTGIQVETTTSNGTEKIMQKWSDLY
jgi:hypothetical protein